MKALLIAAVCVLFLPVIVAGFGIGFAARWGWQSILKGWEAWDDMLNEPLN